MKKEMIHLGYEIGTGEPVSIPVRHLAVTGQTQSSGKTTTLEALISRSQLKALAFITKRGEQSFTQGRMISPYFKERADWQFVADILGAIMGEKMKFERAWIVRVCKGARTLADVAANTEKAMRDSKRSLDKDVYLMLSEYLKILLPELGDFLYSDHLKLSDGLNIMDLSRYSGALQMLVISSCLEYIYAHAHKTVTIIPEAWEMLPQGRNSPVRRAGETLIRKGGALENWLWLDSQDIAGVDKNILRSVGVWIMGVQREQNEVERTLKHIPASIKKPKAADLMTLHRGEFFVCFEREMRRVYVQPSWMENGQAQGVAEGAVDAASYDYRKSSFVIQVEDDAMWQEKYEAEKKRADALDVRVRELEKILPGLRDAAQGKATPIEKVRASIKEQSNGHAISAESIIEEVMTRLRASDSPLIKLGIPVPEIEVMKQKVTATVDYGTAKGRIAALIADGWLDSYRSANETFNELKRQGFPVGKTTVAENLNALTFEGFLRKDTNGWKAVQGMKVRIVEN